jgi:hypothetical protein
MTGKCDDEAEPRPLIDVYWAVPGDLLIGPTPCIGPAVQLQVRLHWLADTGVTTIIDLTEADDRLIGYAQFTNDTQPGLELARWAICTWISGTKGSS